MASPSLLDRLETLQSLRRQVSDESVDQLSPADSRYLGQLLSACLKFLPLERATANEIVDMPWIQLLLQELKPNLRHEEIKMLASKAITAS